MRKPTQRQSRSEGPRRYVTEFNNPREYGLRLGQRLSRQEGVVSVEKLAHKTAWMLEANDLRSAKNAVRNTTHPKKGSAILFSETSGNTYILNNRGNRAGEFEKQ